MKMTSEAIIQNSENTEQQILGLINSNISALSIMSEYLEIEQEIVHDTLQQMIEKGKVKGKITEDGERFYKTDTRMPKEAIADDIEEKDEKFSLRSFAFRVTLIGALIAFIAGQVFVRLDIEGSPLYNMGVASIMLSIFLVLGSLFIPGKKDITDMGPRTTIETQ